MVGRVHPTFLNNSQITQITPIAARIQPDLQNLRNLRIKNVGLLYETE